MGSKESSSPYINRFLSADTIVPGYANPQNLNRYSYVRNNPLRYTDPTGHCVLVDEESDGLCLRQDKKKGTYHIVHPGHRRFKNDVEVAIADFILSGDPTSLNRVPASEPFFVGAATENACTGLGMDCGNYYQTVFWIMAGGFGAWGGAYPPASTGPSYTNNTVPGNLADDVYSSGGWVGGNLPRIEQTLESIDNGGPFSYKQDGKIFKNHEGLLPPAPPGYYNEYTVAAPGATDRGTERIVVGQNGEVYYTPDHYRTFYRIR